MSHKSICKKNLQCICGCQFIFTVSFQLNLPLKLTVQVTQPEKSSTEKIIQKNLHLFKVAQRQKKFRKFLHAISTAVKANRIIRQNPGKIPVQNFSFQCSWKLKPRTLLKRNTFTDIFRGFCSAYKLFFFVFFNFNEGSKS